MGTARILILAVAAVSAIALAFIVRAMASPPAPAAAAPAAAPAPKPMARVLVAKRDLPIGHRLGEGDLGWQPWPVDAVNVAFIVDGAAPTVAPPPTTDKDGKPLDAKAAEVLQAAARNAEAARQAIMKDPGGPIAALQGAIVKEPIFANEPVTDRKLVRAGQSGFLAVVLQPGMRAMAVPVSVETAAGGFILPGDRVDVLLSRQIGSGQNGGVAQFASETVMRNVRVLAVDQTTAPVNGAQAVVGAVATVEVSAEDAEELNLAQAQGDLSLVLRSYADIAGPTGRVARRTYYAAAPAPAQTAAAPATAPAAAPAAAPRPAAPPQPRVRVWRGHVAEVASSAPDPASDALAAIQAAQAAGDAGRATLR